MRADRATDRGVIIDTKSAIRGVVDRPLDGAAKQATAATFETLRIVNEANQLQRFSHLNTYTYFILDSKIIHELCCTMQCNSMILCSIFSPLLEYKDFFALAQKRNQVRSTRFFSINHIQCMCCIIKAIPNTELSID